MNNHILKALSSKDYRAVALHLKPITLPKGAVLYEVGENIGEVYFLEDGMVSYLAETSDGQTLEVGVIGNEGVVGIASIMGDSTAFRAVVQIGGNAYSLKRDILRREFKRCDSMNRILLQYSNALVVQVAQTAVCNTFHSVEERFCRWMLMAHDRSAVDTVTMTQEDVARMLGSRRASVSVVAAGFQKRGAIRYSRGLIRVLDRKRLESSTCECYETIAAAHSKVDA